MVKFFLVLRPYPTYGLVVLGAVTVIGMVSVAWSPGELDSGLGLVLFVQMFLASSGFVITAHRGHFDPTLGCGSDRAAALAAQWLASIAPGTLAWLLLAATGYLVDSPATFSAIAGSRLAAFGIVSMMAWSAGFALPRGGAGALWMGALVFLLVRHPNLIGTLATQGSVVSTAKTAGTLVVCPFLLLGTHGQIGPAPIGAAVAAALAVLFTTWRVGAELDVYLVERS
jgi:hypothetical protein